MKKHILRIAAAALVAAMAVTSLASCKMKAFDGDLRERYDYDDLTEYIKPGKYKGLKVYTGDTSVKKSEVERSILRNRSYYPAEFWEDVPADTPAEFGNIVGLKYQGYLDGEPLNDMSNQKEEGFSIVLGTEMIFVGVDDQVIGMKAGETKTVELTVPEPCYEYPMYAGRTVKLDLEATYIQSAVYAEYNDEFVSSNFGVATVEDFEGEIAKNLNDKRSEEVENYVKTRALMQIEENFELKKCPEKEYNEVYDSLIANAEAEAEEKEQTLAEYAADNGMTEDELYSQAKQKAEQIVFEEMIFYYIARKEQIALTDAAFDEKAEELAADNNLNGVDEYVSFMYYYYGYSNYGVHEQVWYSLVYDFILDSTVRTETK